MSDLCQPLLSLKKGYWFKLICGASFQHLPAVRNLTLAYALAGADCIDVAADPAVIGAAKEALLAASLLREAARLRGFQARQSPLLMVSLNDGEDPHFRKAQFNHTECPTDCPRPCEKVCPAQAIVFNRQHDNYSGVILERCYGCGRCLPICPINLIYAQSYVSTPGAILEQANAQTQAQAVLSSEIDAVEIHTQVGRVADFKRLWASVAPWIDRLKVVAISCPDGEGLIDYLWNLYHLIAPLKCALIWQTDGRPMSGDIGDGTTLAAVKLGQKVLNAGLPGYVQLAGGTNSYTVAKLHSAGLLKRAGGEMGAGEAGEEMGAICGEENIIQRNSLSLYSPPAPEAPPAPPAPPASSHVSGIAYGSYARVLLSPILEQLEQINVNKASTTSSLRLEEQPELLWQAVELANSLVSQLKS